MRVGTQSRTITNPKKMIIPTRKTESRTIDKSKETFEFRSIIYVIAMALYTNIKK